jgi:hypothetical protein
MVFKSRRETGLEIKPFLNKPGEIRERNRPRQTVKEPATGPDDNETEEPQPRRPRQYRLGQKEGESR